MLPSNNLIESVTTVLTQQRQTIAVAESSSGGLIAAALLSVAGASAYFVGAAVIYTQTARDQLIGIDDDAMQGCRSASEPYAQLLAKRIRQIHHSDWGLAETGAAGPTGNRYGDAAGHCCIAVSGPQNLSLTIETQATDRLANMQRFSEQALTALHTALLAEHG